MGAKLKVRRSGAELVHGYYDPQEVNMNAMTLHEANERKLRDNSRWNSAFSLLRSGKKHKWILQPPPPRKVNEALRVKIAKKLFDRYKTTNKNARVPSEKYDVKHMDFRRMCKDIKLFRKLGNYTIIDAIFITYTKDKTKPLVQKSFLRAMERIALRTYPELDPVYAIDRFNADFIAVFAEKHLKVKDIKRHAAAKAGDSRMMKMLDRVTMTDMLGFESGAREERERRDEVVIDIAEETLRQERRLLKRREEIEKEKERKKEARRASFAADKAKIDARLAEIEEELARAKAQKDEEALAREKAAEEEKERKKEFTQNFNSLIGIEMTEEEIEKEAQMSFLEWIKSLLIPGSADAGDEVEDLEADLAELDAQDDDDDNDDDDDEEEEEEEEDDEEEEEDEQTSNVHSAYEQKVIDEDETITRRKKKKKKRVKRKRKFSWETTVSLSTDKLSEHVDTEEETFEMDWNNGR